MVIIIIIILLQLTYICYTGCNILGSKMEHFCQQVLKPQGSYSGFLLSITNVFKFPSRSKKRVYHRVAQEAVVLSGALLGTEVPVDFSVRKFHCCCSRKVLTTAFKNINYLNDNSKTVIGISMGNQMVTSEIRK